MTASKYKTAMKFVNEMIENHPQDRKELREKAYDYIKKNELWNVMDYHALQSKLVFVVKHKTVHEAYEIVY